MIPASIAMHLPLVAADGRECWVWFSYTTSRALQITVQPDIPEIGCRTYQFSRDALTDAFLGGPVAAGDARISVTWESLTLTVTVDSAEWVLRGPSDPVFWFIGQTFDLCPPCSGCTDEFCLSCASVRRQVEAALNSIPESREV